MWTKTQPEDLGGASNGGGQKNHTKKAEIERILDSVVKKKKIQKVLEEVKLEEEKKMVKEDPRLGLWPMTDGPVDVQLRWANLRAREHHVRGPK